MSNKAVFFDRDDTLIKDYNYINDPDQVQLLPGVADALIQISQMGYKLVVVSNQSGIARGILTLKALEQIHDRLKQLLAEQGAYIDEIYYCPYHPEGVIKKYAKESDSRKPLPGMLLKAADEMDIDLTQSWMIGDADRDVLAGQRAGCMTILVNPPDKLIPLKMRESNPDYHATNIKEAVNIIKRYDMAQKKAQQEDSAPAEIETSGEIEQTDPDLEKQEPEPKDAVLESAMKADSSKTFKSDMLLEEILKLLKDARRKELFHEFSATKLLAGILQIVVLFCFMMSVWYLMDSAKKTELILTSLGFAILFQLMALTLYIIQDRK